MIIKQIFLSEVDERRGRRGRVFFGEGVIVMSKSQAVCRICRNRWIHCMYLFYVLPLSPSIGPKENQLFLNQDALDPISQFQPEPWRAQKLALFFPSRRTQEVEISEFLASPFFHTYSATADAPQFWRRGRPSDRSCKKLPTRRTNRPPSLSAGSR